MTTPLLKAAILVVSETAFQDASTDKCGLILSKVLRDDGGGQWEVAEVKIVPDSVLDIQRTVTAWADTEDGFNLIVTSGGTGFAQKDVTPEAMDDALKLIAEHTPVPTIVTAAVDKSLVGSVLAEDVKAKESVPAFRASIVDGYAVITGKDAPSVKGVFPVSLVSHAQAGDVKELQRGHIARITTGAPLPPGATSVVMVEDTVLRSKTDDGKEEKEVEILTDEIQPGENVREVGSDVQAGDVVMKKGEGITAVGGEFGLLASVGTQEVKVFKRPVVGVLSTGDEIVQHDRPEPLRLGEVRDTNRPTLLTAVRGSGFQAVDLGIASDK
ncbi:hypothetical protein LTR28_006991 [Elasticomyces elasticus]|nr:hypothetical protein LTR28_006991 [Elasticomyces elasticus]